jgi:glycosyltransferase involved in cell wall biosynthesis
LNKVVDYMYSGRPIVASFTGFPSMVNEAECGVFVPAGGAAALAEQLTRMASWSDDELSRIGLNGRRWLLANRSYRALAEEYLKVLD